MFNASTFCGHLTRVCSGGNGEHPSIADNRNPRPFDGAKREGEHAIWDDPLRPGPYWYGTGRAPAGGFGGDYP